MKIAVLGGGNGSLAAAADLAEAGHDVCLWRRDRRGLQAILDAGGLTLKDASGTRQVPIALATPDIAEALRGAALIVAASPATAQTDIALAMAPHLEDGQVVFLPPGTFGSFVMSREVQARRLHDVSWARPALPYLARKHGDAEITSLSGRAPADRRLPACRGGGAVRGPQAYPSVHGCGDALSGA